MAITREEAGQQILDDLEASVELLAFGVACLTEAYELLPDAEADRMEDELFGPVQKALGRAKRTREGYAGRVGMSAAGRLGEEVSAGLRSQGAKAFVEKAVDATVRADGVIAGLQDTMLPIEYGDPELREGLASVRELLDGLSSAAREFLRTLGR